MSNNYILTIDLGTSALKTILYDQQFNLISSGSRETETIYPKPTWAEQDQHVWFRSAAMAIKEAMTKANASPNEVKVIGICAQMHGLNLVDKRCHPLMHCLIWPDLRACSQAEAVNRLGRWRISAHYTAAKLLWVKENYPETLDKAYKFLVPTDYLRTRLTGDFCTDPTNAGGTEMFDREKQTWNWDLIDFLGIRRNLFPEIRPTGEIVGKVTDEAAAEMGLSEGTPVITGGGDFSVTVPALLRCEAKGCLLIYLGTAPITGAIAMDGRWVGAGGMSAGGGAGLKWFKEQFCMIEEDVAERTGQNPYVLMDREMSMIKPGSEGLIFLPHLMGERRPYNDYARGVIFGLSLGHRREHVMRALLEGITFHLRSHWEEMKAKTGLEIDRILVFGGGAKSQFWRQLIADVFGYPTYKLKYDDISDLHLAALSAVALGYYKDLDEAYRHIDLSLTQELKPTTEHKEEIEKAFKLFKKVEESLQQVYSPEYVFF
ncbi:MAG: FGGY family carbohydrate kinase [Candidatus Bathyarchaeia archaeon]